jgi:predicted aspartyl protease
MFRFRRRLIALVVLIAVPVVPAGCGSTGSGQLRDGSIRGGDIPLIVVHRGYRVSAYTRVTVTGKPYLFKVDTGATRTIIRTSIAAALGLPMRRQMITTYPLGCTASMRPTLVPKWRLGRIELPSMVIGASKLGNLGPRVDGLSIAGLLGSDVLARFRKATFEFQQHRLILGTNALGSGRAVKLSVLHSAKGGYAELIHVDIDGRPVRLLVDTGDEITAISGRLAGQLDLERLGQTGAIEGASGCPIQVRAVAIKHWIVGGVTLPSTFALSGRVSENVGRLRTQGQLGADVLSAFRRVTIEFEPRHLLIFSDPRFP